MCMGRHTHPDDLDSELALDTGPGRDAAPITAPPKTTAVADLQFLLRRPGLLLACLAAAIVPFGAYFATIADLHKMSDWALFIGAPMVLAGVLVGALLDRAYARLITAPREVQSVTVPASAGPVVRGSRSVEGAHP
jgi:hypothetical protein